MNQLFHRRAALRALVGAAAAACPVCTALAADPPRAGAAAPGAGQAQAAHPHWSYSGEGAPERWGHLQSDFRVCDLGMEQSPVDLRGTTPAQLGGVEPEFRPMPLKIVHNGHTIQVNCPPGSFSTIDGQRYELVQFHFHHPSEHLLEGRRFEIELHFVHRHASGELAVLGVFMKPGARHAGLQAVWDHLPEREGPERSVGVTIDPASLLPANRTYFRYFGSLTTPPCSEGVKWTVFQEPIEVSADQVQRFARLFPVNARPVQSLNRRFLLETR